MLSKPQWTPFACKEDNVSGLLVDRNNSSGWTSAETFKAKPAQEEHNINTRENDHSLLINNIMKCTHFSHPTDEQLRLLDILGNSNLLYVHFELNMRRKTNYYLQNLICESLNLICDFSLTFCLIKLIKREPGGAIWAPCFQFRIPLHHLIII